MDYKFQDIKLLDEASGNLRLRKQYPPKHLGTAYPAELMKRLGLRTLRNLPTAHQEEHDKSTPLLRSAKPIPDSLVSLKASGMKRAGLLSVRFVQAIRRYL
ncbi:hypothetical protein [Undibacterium sp. TC4M20W]|uniref:hypothetical protein n=1 Tax=Undibacterium sp. TC4M20W TaxID=3413052 RepID=UPI003BF57E23